MPGGIDVDCDCLPSCPFFTGRMRNMPATAEVLRQRYCRGDWSSCARCIVAEALGRETVPADLFPHELDRARRLLDARGSGDAPGRGRIGRA